MKTKISIALVFATLSGSAFAEWEGAAGTDDSIIYVDRSTIRIMGQTSKMWSLIDLKTARNVADEKPYKSQKNQIQYECKEESYRILYSTRHSGKMGGGTIVKTSTHEQTWAPVAPGSAVKILWEIACGKG
jgi:hypothetical protein